MAQPSTFSAWQQHDDPRGFTVQHPAGWTVETEDNERILIRNSDRSAFALIQPFLLRQPTSAAEWLGGIPSRYASLFPGAVVQRCEQQSQHPDEAIASLTCTLQGWPAQVNMLCSIDGASGMLFAVAAPQAQFSVFSEFLVRVLESFRFTPPSVPAGTSAGTPSLEYVWWTDPRESAFSLQVPRGWQVTGGTFTFHPSDVRHAVAAVSPDQWVRIYIGDEKLPKYTVPGPMDMALGLPEGSWWSSYGLQMQRLRYLAGTDFARYYVTNNTGYTNIVFVDVRDRPDVAERLQAPGAALVDFVHDTVTAGEVAFTFGDQSPPFHGYCLAATHLNQVFETSNWFVEHLCLYACARDRVDLAAMVASQMARSLVFDTHWLGAHLQTLGKTSEIISRANAETSQMILDSYWRRQEVLDDLARRWSNTILGLTDVVDPYTGETWKLAAGHNYYWRRGSTFVGTDLNERPNINFEPLQQW